MVLDQVPQALAAELLDVVDRAKDARLSLLRQLREVEGRVAAVTQAARPPGEHADALLRRIAEAEARLAQRLAELTRAEAGLTRHTDAALRIEASLSKLSAAFQEQLDVVRPAAKEVGQIKQQLRDAAHAAIEQTRISLEALRSPVQEELAKLEQVEQAAANQVQATRHRVEQAMARSLQLFEERAGESLARFTEQLRQAVDQRVDERIDRVNEQLDHHLRAVNHRLLAQQQQIDDLLDQRQERALTMLADAESVMEQCAAHFDEAQRTVNQRLLQQQRELTALLDQRHHDAIEVIKATQPDVAFVVTDLAAEVRKHLQAHLDTAIADATASLQHQADRLRQAIAANMQGIASPLGTELDAPPADSEQPPSSAAAEVVSTDQLAAPMQEMAARVGALPRVASPQLIDSSLHVG